MDKFQILKSKIGIFLRENLEAPLYVEYLSQMSNETPFEKGGKKWEFVWAKYPDGRRDIGVYSFSEDLVYAYQPWRKMVGIDKGGDTVGASMYDRHFKSDLKEENPITTDDIETEPELDFADEATEPDYENDAFIQDVVAGGYDVSLAGKHIGHFDEMNVALYNLKKETERSNYFPTTWFVSDHGNYWPIDMEGNELKETIIKENSERNKEIAQIILNQLGGAGRLNAMTGAYNFVAIDNGVSFKIKNRSANYIKIVLNGKDLYDVEIGRISGMNYKVVKKQEDVYVDDLKEIIEKSTGMYLSLFEGWSIKKIIENQISEEEEYRNKLDELKASGKITLNIGNHGLIFMQILNSSDLMKSYNTYKEAYEYYLRVNKMMAEGQYGFDDDFDEGPQPGDAEYHYDMGHKRANNGRDVFANIDWKTFWETLVNNTEITKDKIKKGITYSVSDLTDDDGFLSYDSLKHLEDYNLIYIWDGIPIIDETKFLDYQNFYNKAKEIWLQDVRVKNDPSHEPEPYRSGNEDSML